MSIQTIQFIKNKIISLIPVLIGISFITFSLVFITPGNPEDIILEQSGMTVASEGERLQLRQELGLDDSFWVQYLHWLINVLHGNLGNSFHTGRGIVEEIYMRIPYTTIIACGAIGLTTLFSLLYGLVSNYYSHGRIGRLLSLYGQVCLSVPGFLIAIMLVYFFCEVMGIMPSGGLTDVSGLVLPTISMSLISSVMIGQVLNRQLALELDKYYCKVARLRGLSRKRILLEYALPNAIMPVIAMLGNYTGAILGGSVVIEYIFSIPGLGAMALEAIHFRDYPMLQGYVLFTGIVYVMVNSIVDIVLYAINPKMDLRER